MSEQSDKDEVRLTKAGTWINLGSMFGILAMVGGGGFYVSTISGKLDLLADTMAAVRASIERNTTEVVRQGKEIAVVNSVLDALRDRIARLEDKVK